MREFEKNPLNIIYIFDFLHREHLLLLNEAFELLIHFFSHVVLDEKAMLSLLLRG